LGTTTVIRSLLPAFQKAQLTHACPLSLCAAVQELSRVPGLRQVLTYEEIRNLAKKAREGNEATAG
jgi:hypothetical protein